MLSATSQRDENIGAMEGDLASKTSAEAKTAKLDNQKTTADATAGLAGVTKAMKILKDFYDNALIQYKPPKGDASGNTVGDLAPDSFSGDFHGNQDAAAGILGQLDVIKSDFEANIDATKAAEDDAESEFQSYKSETETDMDTKAGEIASKTGEQHSTTG